MVLNFIFVVLLGSTIVLSSPVPVNELPKRNAEIIKQDESITKFETEIPQENEISTDSSHLVSITDSVLEDDENADGSEYDVTTIKVIETLPLKSTSNETEGPEKSEISDKQPLLNEDTTVTYNEIVTNLYNSEDETTEVESELTTRGFEDEEQKTELPNNHENLKPEIERPDQGSLSDQVESIDYTTTNSEDKYSDTDIPKTEANESKIEDATQVSEPKPNNELDTEEISNDLNDKTEPTNENTTEWITSKPDNTNSESASTSVNENTTDNKFNTNSEENEPFKVPKEENESANKEVTGNLRPEVLQPESNNENNEEIITTPGIEVDIDSRFSEETSESNNIEVSENTTLQQNFVTPNETNDNDKIEPSEVSKEVPEEPKINENIIPETTLPTNDESSSNKKPNINVDETVTDVVVDIDSVSSPDNQMSVTQTSNDFTANTKPSSEIELEGTTQTPHVESESKTEGITETSELIANKPDAVASTPDEERPEDISNLSNGTEKDQTSELPEEYLDQKSEGTTEPVEVITKPNIPEFYEGSSEVNTNNGHNVDETSQIPENELESNNDVVTESVALPPSEKQETSEASPKVPEPNSENVTEYITSNVEDIHPESDIPKIDETTATSKPNTNIEESVTEVTIETSSSTSDETTRIPQHESEVITEEITKTPDIITYKPDGEESMPDEVQPDQNISNTNPSIGSEKDQTSELPEEYQDHKGEGTTEPITLAPYDVITIPNIPENNEVSTETKPNTEPKVDETSEIPENELESNNDGVTEPITSPPRDSKETSEESPKVPEPNSENVTEYITPNVEDIHPESDIPKIDETTASSKPDTNFEETVTDGITESSSLTSEEPSQTPQYESEHTNDGTTEIVSLKPNNEVDEGTSSGSEDDLNSKGESSTETITLVPEEKVPESEPPKTNEDSSDLNINNVHENNVHGNTTKPEDPKINESMQEVKPDEAIGTTDKNEESATIKPPKTEIPHKPEPEKPNTNDHETEIKTPETTNKTPPQKRPSDTLVSPNNPKRDDPYVQAVNAIHDSQAKFFEQLKNTLKDRYFDDNEISKPQIADPYIQTLNAIHDYQAKFFEQLKNSLKTRHYRKTRSNKDAKNGE